MSDRFAKLLQNKTFVIPAAIVAVLIIFSGTVVGLKLTNGFGFGPADKSKANGNVATKRVKKDDAAVLELEMVNEDTTINPGDKIDVSNGLEEGDITCESSDPEIAIVDEDCVVTGIKNGTVRIIRNDPNGDQDIDDVDVVVDDVPEPDNGGGSASKVIIDDISIDGDGTMELGATQKLAVAISPEDATNKSIGWQSSNTAIATVNSNGLVTAKSVGSVTITAKATDGSGTNGEIEISVVKTTSASATTYDPLNLYMDPNGVDTRDGLSEQSAVKTLAAVQSKLVALSTNPAYIIKNINVIIKEGTYTGQSIEWYFVNKGYSITFRAREDGKLPKFIGDAGNAYTWFILKYGGGDSNISFRYIWVENYFVAMSLNGGANYTPTEAEVKIDSGKNTSYYQYSPKKDQIYNSGNKLYGMYFYNIGDKYTKPNPTKASWAVLNISNSRNNRIENSHFVNAGNVIAGASSPLHAIYLAHIATNNEILNNEFKNITGDPIRYRNGANNNSVHDNRFTNTGGAGYITEWRCAAIKNCSTVVWSSYITTEALSINNADVANSKLGLYAP
ncbi:MAG: Ig-like domain-containing protein [Candidatus Saccharibacteria bacterium]